MSNHHITTKTANKGRYVLLFGGLYLMFNFVTKNELILLLTNDCLIICVKHRCF